MDFILKFAQTHESFRLPEIQALARVEEVDLEVLEYAESSPLCLLRMKSAEQAAKLVRRSILAQSIHELWGHGSTLDQLNQSVREMSNKNWHMYNKSSFKFVIDSYQGSRSNIDRLSIINSFRYLPFAGQIKMQDPEETFTVLELWPFDSVPHGIEQPDKMYLGRLVGISSRDLVMKFDLKKRHYISTTSMDSELALVTANIALAAPGKLFYDPFVGTGSFPIACAHYGALSWGSDIDGRSIRGAGDGKCLMSNFEQYGLQHGLGDAFAADITNSPIRRGAGLWDGIVCDPPYGVREGLRVLGLRDPAKTPWLLERGLKDGMLPDYIPPKKPYSFMAILDDILVFASETLVDNGRLAFWMPTANEEEQQIPPPTHPSLKIVATCVQIFNKCEDPFPFPHLGLGGLRQLNIAGSRRLITYQKLPASQVSDTEIRSYRIRKLEVTGVTADELNPFRRGYFRGFKVED